MRPHSAVQSEPLRRRDLLRQPPPTEGVVRGFSAPERAAASIREYKEFLRSHVEIWRATDRKVSGEVRRPKTSSALARHCRLWTPGEIAARAAAATPAAMERQGGAPAAAACECVRRDLDEFALRNVPLDDEGDDDDEEEEKAHAAAEKAHHAALRKLKAATAATGATRHGPAGSALAATGAAALKGPGDATRRLPHVHRSRSSVPADAVIMRYLLAAQALRAAVEAHPRPLVRLLYTAVAAPEGLDVVARGGRDIRAVRRKTFSDRLGALLVGSEGRLGVALPAEQKAREKALRRAVARFNAIFDSFDLFHDDWVAHRPFLAALDYLDAPTVERWLQFIFTALSVHDSTLHRAELHAVRAHVLGELVPRTTHSLGRIPFTRAAVNPHFTPPPPPRPLSAAERPLRMWGRAGSDRWSAQQHPLVVELGRAAEVLFEVVHVNGVAAGPPGAVDVDAVLRRGDSAVLQSVDIVAWRELRTLVVDHLPAMADVITSALL